MQKKETKNTNKDKATSSKMYARDYRHRAIDVVKPVSGSFAVVYFVYTVLIGAIIGLIAAFMFAGTAGIMISSALEGLFVLLTSGAFIFSFINLSKQAHKGGKPTVGNLFFGFKERFAQSLGVYIIRSIFTVLWSLLLFIPGIIKSYSYSMALYVALDNPNMSTLDCITESRKIMDGHKWQLFCLEFSYIGWFILIILTLGILSFWVMPKFNQAHYEFYLHITNKK